WSSANVQADANRACPEAKNLVAREAKAVIDSFRTPITEYFVSAGSDDVIPFFRLPDKTEIGNERQYVPPVRDATHSQSSLRLGYILSDAPYSSTVAISRFDGTLPVFDLAVGRLVETANDILGVLAAYPTGGVITPTKSA